MNQDDSIQVEIVLKGKPKPCVVKLESEKNFTILKILETSRSWRPLFSFNVRTIVSEMRPYSEGKAQLAIIAPDTEIVLLFKNHSDADAIHAQICRKSDVFSENYAIDDLDKQIKLSWPLPPGSFF